MEVIIKNDVKEVEKRKRARKAEADWIKILGNVIVNSYDAGKIKIGECLQISNFTSNNYYSRYDNCDGTILVGRLKDLNTFEFEYIRGNVPSAGSLAECQQRKKPYIILRSNYKL